MSAKKRKRPEEMTDDEVMLSIFPKEAVEAMKQIAHAQDRRSERKDQPQDGS